MFETAYSIEQIVTLMRAAGEPTRLRILALLADGELTVSEFTQILGQSQPRVSRHLKLLADAGLVQRLPEGAWAFYRLAEPGGPARGLIDAAMGVIASDDAARQRDRERLARVKRARAEAAAAYFTSVAADWDQIRGRHWDEQAVENALGAAAGPGPFSFMVDVGVGSGRILQVFAERVERAVGVDLSHEMLTVARAQLDRAGLGHCSVRHGDLYALPLPEGVADLATIHLVLHYLDAPARAIAEAARVLRPGGVLLVADFARHNLEILREHHAHRRLGFADEELAEWFAAAGLHADPVVTVDRPAHEDRDDRQEEAPGLVVKIWRARALADSVQPSTKTREAVLPGPSSKTSQRIRAVEGDAA